MSVFSRFGCLIDKHEPLRREVSWNGLTYVGHCRHCGVPIKRKGRKNWSKQDE